MTSRLYQRLGSHVLDYTGESALQRFPARLLSLGDTTLYLFLARTRTQSLVCRHNFDRLWRFTISCLLCSALRHFPHHFHLIMNTVRETTLPRSDKSEGGITTRRWGRRKTPAKDASMGATTETQTKKTFVMRTVAGTFCRGRRKVHPLGGIPLVGSGEGSTEQEYLQPLPPFSFLSSTKRGYSTGSSDGRWSSRRSSCWWPFSLDTNSGSGGVHFTFIATSTVPSTSVSHAYCGAA